MNDIIRNDTNYGPLVVFYNDYLRFVANWKLAQFFEQNDDFGIARRELTEEEKSSFLTSHVLEAGDVRHNQRAFVFAKEEFTQLMSSLASVGLESKVVWSARVLLRQTFDGITSNDPRDFYLLNDEEYVEASLPKAPNH